MSPKTAFRKHVATRGPVTAAEAEIRIGSAGWTIPTAHAAEFQSEGTHLQRYAQVFSCCEINSSFYRPHRTQTWVKWAEAVPADFKFAVKAPRAVTHDAKLDCPAEALSEFFAQLSPLGEKLGPVLFQLPPSLEFSARQARIFLRQLRAVHEGQVVFEPRNATWFGEAAGCLLKDFKVSRVASDPARVAEAAKPGGWPGLAYFRLHGSPRMYYSLYDCDFLESLATQIASLAQSMPVWCIFDNTASGAAARNALDLTQLIQRVKREPQSRKLMTPGSTG